MKKLSYLALFAAILTLGACSYDMKEKFSEDASIRVEKTMKEYAQILQSAPNGWIVYYFADTYYGGYNMVMKFGTDSVEAMSEISAPYSEKSHYRLEQSTGIVLSFDEYNNVIHYFSDPINPDGVGDAGYGFEGDHEWRIQSCTSEKIVCRGKKGQSRIELVPLPAEYTPESYFEALETVITDMNSANIFTTVAGDTIATTKNATYNSFSFVLPQENGTTVNYTRPFIYTLDGIKLYSPLEYNGHTITGFKYVPLADKFNEFDDNDVILHLVIKPINVQLVEGAWYIGSADDVNATNASLFKTLVDAIYSAEQEECAYVYIGNYTGQATTKIYMVYRSANYISVGSASYELIGDDAIKIGDFAAVNSNWTYYARYPLANAASVFSKTFDIEYDLLKAPTYVVLKERGNASNVITLRNGLRAYPFGTH